MFPTLAHHPGPVLSGAVLGLLAAGLVLLYRAPAAEHSELHQFSNSSVNEVNHLRDLAAITLHSDVVIRGLVREVRPGAEFGRDGIDRVHYAVLSVEVSSVVSAPRPGVAARGDIIEVDFFLGGSSDVSSLREAFLGVDGLWFLLDKEAEARRLGLTGAAAERDRGLYMLTNSQGLVVESEGKTHAPLAHPSFDDGAYFEAVEGKSLPDVVALARAALDP